MGFTHEKLIWKDRKRILGLPLTFTRYAMSEDRLFMSTGFLTIRDEEILLYRLRDISMSRTLGQRLFNVGTLEVASSDKSDPVLKLVNIKHPGLVKELLHEQAEHSKMRRRVRFSEVAAYSDGLDDGLDPDGDMGDF